MRNNLYPSSSTRIEGETGGLMSMNVNTQTKHEQSMHANSQTDCWFFCISWELISQTLPASEIRQINKCETWAALHGATQKSLSHSTLTCSTLHFQCFNGCTHALHLEMRLFYLVRLKAHTNMHPSTLAQAYTHTHNNAGDAMENEAEDACWELKKMWEYEIKNGKNNRMKSQDACWLGACL